MRFLIANLLFPDGDTNFLNIEERVPDIYKHSDESLRLFPRPRCLKSHESFLARYRRVIYIVRDPRDVVLSYYFFLLKHRRLAPGSDMLEFVARFLDGEVGMFGQWAAHVSGWLDARAGDDDFLLLRYEDLQADPLAALRRVAGFCALKPDDARLGQALAASDFHVMQGLEGRQEDQWQATRHTDKHHKFVRQGRAGGWKDELPPAGAELIAKTWDGLLQRLGYA